MARARIETFDGVGVAMLRDTVIVWWVSPSTTARVQWSFDMAEKARATSPKGVLVLQIIPPSSSPPDAEARKVALERFTALGPLIRKMVAVPLGDDLWAIVVRTIMRGIFLVSGNSKVLRVADRDSALDVLFEAACETTPSRAEVLTAIDELARVMELPEGAFTR